MSYLAQARCTACRADTPPLSGAELEELLREIPNWRIDTCDGHLQLQRTYPFADFRQALAFTNAVGNIAEAADHHPTLLTEWGTVTVTWWTHSIGGLHRNDFIMAARTDALAAGAEGRQ